MAYRWGFDLIGMNWVESLSWTLHGPDVTIIREEEDARPPVFFWASRHLDELDEVPEVASRAGALKRLFDGALYIVHGHEFRPERLGELWDLREEHRAGFPELQEGGNPFSDKVCREPLSASEAVAVAEKLIPGSLYAARQDLVVRGMLDLLGAHGITFVSLYALRDTMKTHGMKEKEQWEAANSSKEEMRLFTHTANNFQATGANARHGDLGHNAPPVPMTLSRASEIILAAAHLFISRRIATAAAHLKNSR